MVKKFCILNFLCHLLFFYRKIHFWFTGQLDTLNCQVKNVEIFYKLGKKFRTLIFFKNFYKMFYWILFFYLQIFTHFGAFEEENVISKCFINANYFFDAKIFSLWCFIFFLYIAKNFPFYFILGK